MSDISVDIEIKKKLEAGENVQAWAFCVPEPQQRAVAAEFGRVLLPSGWVGDENPDMFYVGEPSKPANIEDCRDFMRDISLRPVLSMWRVGVIFAADKLLLPAANSLLKITEEPPVHVKLLFLMQTNALLPTLRSRVRFDSFLSVTAKDTQPIPESDSQWFKWLENLPELPDITLSLEGWGSEALKAGKFELAFKIENIRLLLDGGKLTKAMACDLVLLAIKEDLAIEDLFGNFW